MKRPACMLVLLLALGLCTSVLVAWAGALVDRGGWPDTFLTRSPVGTRTAMRGWLVEQGRDRSLTWRTFAALDLHMEPPDLDAPTTLPAWSVGRALADQPGPFVPARERTRLVAWEVSAGWPLRCVRAVRTAGPAEFALPGEFVRGGLPAMAYGWPMPAATVAGADGLAVAPWPAGGRAAVVPLRPMVGGLVVNTVAFALAWAAALSPLVVLRPLRRLRRNRCVACGHAREGLPSGAPCAECGRDPSARTPARELLTARAPMLGAALALPLVLGASAALPTHRWMAVDRLPPLHHAAAVGDVEEVERLVAGGADIEGQFFPNAGSHEASEFATPLMYAAGRGRGDAIATLLRRGASPDGLWSKVSPLDLAIRSGDTTSAHAILDALAWPVPTPIDGRELVHADDTMRTRLIGLNAWSERAYHWACLLAMKACDPGLYAMLHDALADRLDIWPERAFEYAIGIDAEAAGEPWRRELGLTARMLDVGLPVRDADRDRVLQRLLRHGPASAALAMLDAGARPSPDALADAAFLGDPTLVQRLLDMGLDANADAGLFGPPLAFALMKPSPDAVQLLLEAGANPFNANRGLSHRTILLESLGEHGDFRQLAQDGPDPDRVRAFARILDLLEAAELEWSARAEPDAAPPAPGGR